MMSNAELYEKAVRVIRSVENEKQIPAMRKYFFLVKRHILVGSVYWEMLWDELFKKLNEYGLNYQANWDAISMHGRG
jgi:hypothetical protein